MFSNKLNVVRHCDRKKKENMLTLLVLVHMIQKNPKIEYIFNKISKNIIYFIGVSIDSFNFNWNGDTNFTSV